MIDLCDVIELEVVLNEPEIELELDFEGEYISGSDGQDYKRGYDEGHAQGLIDGQADGYKNGYDEGHRVGHSSGYDTGKTDGLTEGYDNGYAQGKADGYQAGYDEGYQKGYTEGYSQGLAEGTKEEQEKSVTITQNGTTEITPDENKVLSKVTVEVNVADSFYDTFWDDYQQNGVRTDYNYAFAGYGWTDITFKPKYDVVPELANCMFGYTTITDLTNLDVNVDFSKCTDMRNCFISSSLTHIGIVNLIKLQRSNWAQNIFSNATKLHTIDKLILPVAEVQNHFDGYFLNCWALENITIEGEFWRSVSFPHSSKLTTESVDSIINALADLTGADSQTLTVHKDVFGRMSDEQKAFVTSKNWTLASSK